MMKGYDPTTVLFYVFLLGTFMIIPIMNLPGTVTIVMDDLGLLGFIVIIGIFFTLTPYYLYSRGLKDLQPSTVTILLFVETASAALAGLMFYNEQLTLLDIFGLGLILISLFLVDRDVDNKDE